MQSEEIAELAAALVKAQAEFPEVVKSATAQVKSFSYNYATLPDVQRAVGDVLAEHDLCVVQGTVDEDDGGFTVTTTLIHASGQWLTRRVRVPVRDGTAQAAGSGFSYGRRIGLVGLLGVITNDEDDDGAAASEAGDAPERPAPKREPAPRPQPPTPTKGGQECPDCGGEMWDNRPKKASGQFKPTAPDFKCKDESCGGVIWPSDDTEGDGPGKPGNDLEDPFDDHGMPF